MMVHVRPHRGCAATAGVVAVLAGCGGDDPTAPGPRNEPPNPVVALLEVAPGAVEGVSDRQVDVGDIDGDGDPDLVFPGGVAFNDGAGAFTLADDPWTLGAESAVASIVLVDVDGDQDLDQVLGVRPPGQGAEVRIALNDGAGAFEEGAVVLDPLPTIALRDLLARDVDGDGRVDLVAIGNGGAILYLQQQDGSFVSPEATLPRGPAAGESGTIGDVDSDGDLDILLGSLGPVELFLREGDVYESDPAVWEDTRSGQGEQFTEALSLGDVDGDGDLDVYVANGDLETDDRDRILLNLGNALVDEGAARLPGGGLSGYVTRDVAWIDLDGDGDDDLVLAGFTSQTGTTNPLRLLLNDGSGFFEEAPTGSIPPLAGAGASLAVEDYDGDGISDVLLTGGNQTPRLLLGAR